MYIRERRSSRNCNIVNQLKPVLGAGFSPSKDAGLGAVCRVFRKAGGIDSIRGEFLLKRRQYCYGR